MSTQRKPDFIEEDISEQAVQDYLERNPDFFERNSALLGSLRVPHGTGEAVSLVERQDGGAVVERVRFDRIRSQLEMCEDCPTSRNHGLIHRLQMSGLT